MKTDTKNTPKNPLANLDSSDLKIVSAMVAANTKATKASEALTLAIGTAYNAGLHTKAGYTNFGHWFVEAMAAKGTSVGKSRAYNAVKITDLRNASPKAADLSDTVCLRIAEMAPAGDAEATDALVAEVIGAGGTVEAVKTVAGGDGKKTDPADALAEMLSERLWKICKGDVLAAEAIVGLAMSTYKAKCIAQTK